jgi:hypothetical protein
VDGCSRAMRRRTPPLRRAAHFAIVNAFGRRSANQGAGLWAVGFGACKVVVRGCSQGADPEDEWSSFAVTPAESNKRIRRVAMDALTGCDSETSAI